MSALANAVGTGVADDKVIYYFVPRMIEYYLGQEPILPNVPTYLASEKDDLKYILGNLPGLVVKAANESGGYGMLMGPSAAQEEIDEFRKRIVADPRNFIAQPVISLSQSPTWCDGGMDGGYRSAALYLIRRGCENRARRPHPGGLKKGSLVVNSSQGGGSKDTWVLRQ